MEGDASFDNPSVGHVAHRPNARGIRAGNGKVAVNRLTKELVRLCIREANSGKKKHRRNGAVLVAEVELELGQARR